MQILVKLNAASMHKSVLSARREDSFGRQIQSIIRNVLEMAMQSFKVSISVDIVLLVYMRYTNTNYRIKMVESCINFSKIE